MIVLAGATGNLGGRIARALLQRGAGVIALVRDGSAPGKVDELRTLGATIAEVDFTSLAALTSASNADQGGARRVSRKVGRTPTRTNELPQFPPPLTFGPHTEPL